MKEYAFPYIKRIAFFLKGLRIVLEAYPPVENNRFRRVYVVSRVVVNKLEV